MDAIIARTKSLSCGLENISIGNKVDKYQILSNTYFNWSNINYEMRRYTYLPTYKDLIAILFKQNKSYLS